MPSAPKIQQREDAKALKELISPVAPRLFLARVLAAASGALAVVPYIALANIGAILLTAGSTSRTDEARISKWLFVLITSFTLRILLYFVALLITHRADILLGHHIRTRLIDRLSRAPLGWFTSNSSGSVRKALQDDIVSIHNLIAHRPVEITNAYIIPISLMIYAFIIDWRLGLLSIAILPVYVITMAIPMKGMGEKTVQMDAKLGEVSARMVEFVSGITVVKAFGRVGKAHDSYQKSSDAFPRVLLRVGSPAADDQLPR